MIDDTQLMSADITKKSICERLACAEEHTLKQKEIDISKKDISILVEDGWLNDNIINSYFELLEEQIPETNVHIMRCFVYPLLNLKREYRPEWLYSEKHMHMFRKDCVLIPICTSKHWILGIIDHVNRTVQIYNSMSSGLFGDSTHAQKIKRYVEECTRRQNAKVSYTVKKLKRMPRQENGYDCGVFVCCYARRFIEGSSLDFTNRDVTRFRLQMAHEMLEKKIFRI